MYVLDNDGKQQKVTINDEKIEGMSILNIQDEDHTLGNVIRLQLLRDRSVKFAGYRKPHPLENRIELKCQTNVGQKKPSEAIQDSCSDLISHLDTIESKFREALEQFQGGAAGSISNPGGRMHHSAADQRMY